MDKQTQDICKISLESFLQDYYSNPYLKFGRRNALFPIF